MPYTETFLENATTITQVAQGVNNAGEGIIFTLFLLTFAIIIFIVGIRTYDFKTTLLADSFITAMMAIGLYTLNLVPEVTLGLCIATLFITAILKIWTGD